MKLSGLYRSIRGKQRGTSSLFVFLLLILLLAGCKASPSPPAAASQTLRADYDGDGREEAFAVVLVKDGDDEREQLWFRGADGKWVDLDIESFDMGEAALLETSTRAFAHFEAAYATGTETILLTVREGAPCLEPVQGQALAQMADGGYVLLQNTLDASYMDGYSAGRTIKPYWLYWDTQADCFREYGAVEISRDALSALPGGPELLAQVDGEVAGQDGRLDHILLRSNDTVQVNYTLHYLPDDGGNPAGDSRWHCLWLNPAEQPENWPSAGEGIYLPALLPELAVYPEDVEP